MAARRHTPPTYYEALDSPISLPAYSPDASSCEQSVARSSESHGEHVRTSAHITLNLGPKVWRTNFPCYGRNAVIEGFVDLSKLEHASRVDVTFSGKITNAVTDRGNVIAQVEKSLVNMTENLYPSGNSEAVGTGISRYRFAIPIPSYVQGGNEELPPSFIAWHPRYSSQVKYLVKVDMYRKGLRVHESTKVQVFYLPASCCPAIRQLDLTESPEISLCEPRLNSDVCGSAKLRIPFPKMYPVSTIIPFSLRFVCPTSPWLSKLVAQNVASELVRYITLLVEGRRSIRESILGRGEIWDTREEVEGTYYLRGSITGGNAGSEYSWRIPEMTEVKYVLRFLIPDEARKKTSLLPTFKHEEVIVLTTHEADNDSGIQEMPCLGLLAPGSFQQGSQPPSESSSMNVGQYFTLR